MSAFICSDLHIATVAQFVAPDNAQNLADKLKQINIASVNYRYNEKTRTTKCKMQIKDGLTIDDVAKLIDCLDYQSCENPHSIDYRVYSGFLYSWVTANRANADNGKFWSV
jgi:hypothetical protein